MRLSSQSLVGVNNIGIFKEFDSKAMRKVEEGQDIVQVVENEINGCTVTISGRMLLKLH